MPYIEIPVETEPLDLATLAYEYLQDQIDGWLPSPGNLEAWLVEAIAQQAGEVRDLAALVPDAIFEYYGTSILGLPPYDATPAVGSTTWTANDSAGYTVNAGALVGITPVGADTIAFQLLADLVIPPGTTTVAAVQVQALEAGAAASEITGVVEPLDNLSFIASVTLDAPTSGGVDAEDTDAYLNRLSDLFTLLTPRPILPSDFALLAKNADAAVARATAIDLYNPGPPINTNCPRCVTVALVDVNGDPVPPAVKANVDALLQAQREVNFLVFVIDPAYTTIDVSAHVVCLPLYQKPDVEALVTTAVQDFLSPANWGVPPQGDDARVGSWTNNTVVRYLDLTSVVDGVDGVDYIVDLTFGKQGSPLAKTDVTLTGTAPLPKAGAIAIVADPAA